MAINENSNSPFKCFSSYAPEALVVGSKYIGQLVQEIIWKVQTFCFSYVHHTVSMHSLYCTLLKFLSKIDFPAKKKMIKIRFKPEYFKTTLLAS